MTGCHTGLLSIFNLKIVLSELDASFPRFEVFLLRGPFDSVDDYIPFATMCVYLKGLMGQLFSHSSDMGSEIRYRIVYDFFHFVTSVLEARLDVYINPFLQRVHSLHNSPEIS